MQAAHRIVGFLRGETTLDPALLAERVELLPGRHMRCFDTDLATIAPDLARAATRRCQADAARRGKLPPVLEPDPRIRRGRGGA